MKGVAEGILSSKLTDHKIVFILGVLYCTSPPLLPHSLLCGILKSPCRCTYMARHLRQPGYSSRPNHSSTFNPCVFRQRPSLLGWATYAVVAARSSTAIEACLFRPGPRWLWVASGGVGGEWRRGGGGGGKRRRGRIPSSSPVRLAAFMNQG